MFFFYAKTFYESGHYFSQSGRESVSQSISVIIFNVFIEATSWPWYFMFKFRYERGCGQALLAMLKCLS